jgi:hypothetical protein
VPFLAVMIGGPADELGRADSEQPIRAGGRRASASDGVRHRPVAISSVIAPMNDGSVQRSWISRDVAFLTALVLLAVVGYLPRLGFYSDAWAFLGAMRLAGSSVADQYAALGDVRWRPVQAFLLATLYHAFGTNPLPFHVVNNAALIAGVICLYLVLVELGLSRIMSVAISLLYGLLPHYSADRFWIAAMQATVSMALYFGSLYAELRAATSPRARWLWWTLAMVARVLCVMAYEVFLPLLFVNSFIAWINGRCRTDPPRERFLRPSGLLIQWAVTALTLAPVVIYKISFTTRPGHPISWDEHLHWGWRIYQGATSIAASDLGVLLPRAAWRLWHSSPSIPALAVALISGLLAYGYLAQTAGEGNGKNPWRDGLGLVGVGVVTFWAGYAVCVIVKVAGITTAGIGNRIAIAAAAGVALVWVGCTSLATIWIPNATARRRSFAAITATLYAFCVFVNASLGALWAEAYRRAVDVIVSIKREYPEFPGRGSLIIDGICPYVGPAVVFDSSWDLTGALQVLYGQHGLKADIITPNMTVTDHGLVASLYSGLIVTHYPYAQMSIFNVPRALRVSVRDVTDVRRYLETYNPDRSGGCAIGTAGEGVAVF